ncbi:exodeoxyribonuclease V subunit alpha [Oceanimonas baumannii]|uniref:RecBCD enzyme subunit RecD n=1 Tax=Oceanimonas baumannii TaxID=129578 RepID=A0A235CEY9_9GAMM|nr:exodeoxyribonuclease V subunit alpha [Oceanimonas baumannii]OYD23130.1 exodeoxyribonuclease V subunit alpha [Oceanimonas baumannii]TDW58402.1 DNA helicase/exodeoxyribonuclease V alpha subunit [Oceanimonas baumannii]
MITTETTPSGLLELLEHWVTLGWLRPLDQALTHFLAEQVPQTDARVLLAAALASHQLGHGHVCLDLAATLAEPDFALSLPPEGEDGLADAWLPSTQLADLNLESWLAALADSALVAAAGEPDRPLVLKGERLYLRRYWRYEQGVARALSTRIDDDRTVPADLHCWLERLFPEPLMLDGVRQTDWQKLACALAVSSGFTLITGGPGTGKTTTVVRLLALLQSTAEQPLRIRLAAPTGKAAARLTESIGAQVASLPVDERVRAHIPAEVSTLHRLLGSLPGSRHFRHHAGNPLPLDVLVVDEASMIDLEMMHSLLMALPSHARLLMLGDKDQLASVEAGALLGDLCCYAEQGLYTPERLAWLEQVSGERVAHPSLVPGEPGRHALAQRVLMLRYSRRFAGGSGIGRLAEAVNGQQPALAREQLQRFDEVASVRVRGEQDRALNRLLHQGRGAAAGYGDYLTQLHGERPATGTAFDDTAWHQWAGRVLTAFDRFRLLCAVRRGPWGVEGLNQRIAGLLHRRGLLEAEEGWYEGRPVLVTRNDYGLGLMNGDIGIALRLPEGDGRTVLRVAFPRNDGSDGLRFVLPSRLSDVETVFAMTVHKSQGSEFAHTALILPHVLNPILTKELLYTGITRARDWFTLLETGQGVFEQAIGRRVERRSGLLETLQQQG